MTSKWTTSKALSVVALSVGLLFAAGCGGGDDDGGDSGGDEQVVIGFAAALTGPIAPYDAPFIEGLEIGIDEINADGGILGQPAELVLKDMRSDPGLSGTVAQELVEEDGANILVTPSDADPSIGAGQYGQEAGIPTVAAGATAPTLPGAVGDFMFSSALTDHYKATSVAVYAFEELGYKTAYTMGSPDSAYTDGFVKYFTEVFEGLGGEIVGEDTYKLGETDFSAQVTKMKEASPQPDFIFTPAYMPDVAAFYKQLRAAGVDTPVIGGDGNDTTTVIDAAGDAAEGVVFTTHGFPEEGSALADLYDRYEEIHGNQPESSFVGLGWDLAQVMKAAFEEAGSTDGQAVRDALDQLEGVEGATGTITYAGQERLPKRTVALVQIKNGEFELVTFDDPDPDQIPEP